MSPAKPSRAEWSKGLRGRESAPACPCLRCWLPCLQTQTRAGAPPVSPGLQLAQPPAGPGCLSLVTERPSPYSEKICAINPLDFVCLQSPASCSCLRMKHGSQRVQGKNHPAVARTGVLTRGWPSSQPAGDRAALCEVLGAACGRAIFRGG